MSYTKMQPSDFISKLESGGYDSATAARRAVGKSAFNDAGKKKCYAAIDAKFGNGSPKAAAKKTTKAPAAKAKKTAAAPKAKAAKAAKAAAPKAAAATKKTAKAAAPQQARKPRESAKSLGVSSSALEELGLAESRVGTITQALKALQMAKEVAPNINLDDHAKGAADALSDVVQGIHTNVIGSQAEQKQQTLPHVDAAPSNGAVDPAVASRFAATAPAAGGVGAHA